MNISDFLGKIKKGLELHAMCFVFKSAVVFLCKERIRQKKKLMVRILPNVPPLFFYGVLYFCILKAFPIGYFFRVCPTKEIPMR